MQLSILILLFGVVISVVVAQQENHNQKPENGTVAKEQPKIQNSNPILCNRCRRWGNRGRGNGGQGGGITVNGQRPNGNLGLGNGGRGINIGGGRRRGRTWRRGRGWRRNRRRLTMSNSDKIKPFIGDNESNQTSGDIGKVQKTDDSRDALKEVYLTVDLPKVDLEEEVDQKKEDQEEVMRMAETLMVQMQEEEMHMVETLMVQMQEEVMLMEKMSLVQMQEEEMLMEKMSLVAEGFLNKFSIIQCP
ncbi:hypothetical protein M3Y98_00603000 [Aphelenchoides besseyi]|nr:hypothetical protein M3Y98_00603000 [Aphelenchoides besseyi]